MWPEKSSWFRANLGGNYRNAAFRTPLTSGIKPAASEMDKNKMPGTASQPGKKVIIKCFHIYIYTHTHIYSFNLGMCSKY